MKLDQQTQAWVEASIVEAEVLAGVPLNAELRQYASDRLVGALLDIASWSVPEHDAGTLAALGEEFPGVNAPTALTRLADGYDSMAFAAAERGFRV